MQPRFSAPRRALLADRRQEPDERRFVTTQRFQRFYRGLVSAMFVLFAITTTLAIMAFFWPMNDGGGSGGKRVPGADGEDGANGTTGFNGTRGPIGPRGLPGLNGTDGAPGINGTDGAPGINGTDGADGAPGVNGTDGADGATGPQGPPGVNGTDGVDGADGADGVDGADGADGLTFPNATYITFEHHDNLTCERVLTFDPATFNVTDTGCNGEMKVDLTHTGVVAGTYEKATITVDDEGRLTDAYSEPSVCESVDAGANFTAPDDLILLYTFREQEPATQTADLSGFGTAVPLKNGPSSSQYNWRYPCGLHAITDGTVWRTGDGTGTDSSAQKVSDAIKATGQYSIELWLHTTDSTQNNPARIFTMGNGATSQSDPLNTAFMIGQEGNDDIQWRLPNGAAASITLPNALLTNYLDAHLFFVYNGTHAKIYWQGKEYLDTAITSGIGSWGTNYEISAFDTPWVNPVDKRPWRGILHRVAMWRRALTVDEVRSTHLLTKCWPRDCHCDCS